MKKILFSLCTLTKHDVFFVFLKYTIETWSIFCFSHVRYWNVKFFCFSHVHYRNMKYFLLFLCTLSEREEVFVFLMYTIKTGNTFCFPHVHYRNVMYFLLFSCTLWKREVPFVFLMYTIETWGVCVCVFFFFERHYINVKCFYFSHVHYREVKYFLFFPCRLWRREAVFVYLKSTFETWNNLVFLIYPIET